MFFRGNNFYVGKEECWVGLGFNLGVYDYVRDGYFIFCVIFIYDKLFKVKVS